MCTTKPPRIDGTTFFKKNFFHHRRQEDTLVHHNSVEKVKFLYFTYYKFKECALTMSTRTCKCGQVQSAQECIMYLDTVDTFPMLFVGMYYCQMYNNYYVCLHLPVFSVCVRVYVCVGVCV